jgi:hypothetical protein
MPSSDDPAADREASAVQPAIDSLNRSADELKAVPGAGREPIPAAFMVACAAAWMPLENAIGGYATRTDLGADAREILEDVTQELAILRRALYHAASQWSELLIQEAAAGAEEWMELAWKERLDHERKGVAPVRSRREPVAAGSRAGTPPGPPSPSGWWRNRPGGTLSEVARRW